MLPAKLEAHAIAAKVLPQDHFSLGQVSAEPFCELAGELLGISHAPSVSRLRRDPPPP